MSCPLRHCEDFRRLKLFLKTVLGPVSGDARVCCCSYYTAGPQRGVCTGAVGPTLPAALTLSAVSRGQGTDLGVSFSQSPGSSGPVPRLGGQSRGDSCRQVRGGGRPWLAPFLSAVLTFRDSHPPGPPAPCPGGAERHGGEPAAPHCPGGLPQPAPGESRPHLLLGPCGEGWGGGGAARGGGGSGGGAGGGGSWGRRGSDWGRGGRRRSS